MEKYFKYTKEHADYIANKDEDLKKLINIVGMIKREMKADLYSSLVDTIVGQQISTAAHDTIRKRFYDYFKDITPENINKASEEELQKLGISFRKASYIKDLTDKVVNNEINLQDLNSKNDQEVIEELIKLKGIGVWSAQMLMTFSMNRLDIIAYDDLAIRRGICKLYNLDEINKQQFAQITDKFTPYRTVAALYFWHYANPKCEIQL